MIPVNLTCESEPVAEDGRHRPVIRLNGAVVWQGRPEATPEDAERVALAYLRYALGGVLGGPEEPAPRPGSGADQTARRGADLLTEAVEALGQEAVAGLRRVSEFLERGEWRRFLR